MFKTTSPEFIGIPSEKVLNFFKTINSYGLNTHSVIMARGNSIFAESYYYPYSQNTLHRMYSVSKSFVAVAVGLAEHEGLLSLDDKLIKYFPEHIDESSDKKLSETSIGDMLTMRSCMAKYADWWNTADRVKAYFSVNPNQISGTNFYYDSAGCFILGCIVEKVTHMPFLEYLKQKILLEIGFSKESYCLLAPGGHSLSDSGVMCTTRDLLIFARFVMNGGVWNGKRYINEAFMQNAISKQTDNNLSGIPTPLYDKNGYGYFIWKMPHDGFAFIGMADQLAICDPKTDFIFVMTAENMVCEDITKTIIMHELYKEIIDCLNSPLAEDEATYHLLKQELKNQKMMHLENSLKTNVAEKISGNKYILEDNPMGIKELSATLTQESGILEYRNCDGINKIEFGIGYNKFGEFPENKRIGLTAGTYEKGNYKCAASAAWCEEAKLHIMVRITDTYLGTLSIILGFKENNITVSMKKFSQRILDNYEGTGVGIKA